MRAFLKLDKSVEGMVVHKPDSSDPAYPLKEWDVITKIGDTPVDDQGMIKLGANLRVRFQYLVQKIAKNGKVPLTVVRAGKEMPDGTAGVAEASDGHAGPGGRLPVLFRVRAAGVFRRHGTIHRRFYAAATAAAAGSTGSAAWAARW